MLEVEILGIVVTHQYGTLNTGDVLRTDPEFARHLVEDCGAAKYRAHPSAAPPVEARPADVVQPPEDPAPDPELETPPADPAPAPDASALAKPGRKAKAQ